MKIPNIVSVCAAFILISSQVFASPDQDVLDEITIRVMENENMSINVTDIALPNIAGEQDVDHADAADNADMHADLARILHE